MNIDERLEAVARNLDVLTQIHLDSDREFRERFEKLEGTIDKLTVIAAKQSDSIQALARIAEAHEQRFDDLEGDQPHS